MTCNSAIMSEQNKYPVGKFGFIPYDMDRLLLISAFNALDGAVSGFQYTPNWIALRTHKPPVDSGFMFWSNPPKEIQNVMDIIEKDYPGHSGMTFGWTMRQLQYIAVNGWDEYVKFYIENIK
jgi:hypothetical protein